MTWEKSAERPSYVLKAGDTGMFVSFRMAEKYNMKLVYTKNFYDFFQDKAKETASLLYKMKVLEVHNGWCWCSIVSVLMAYAVLKWFSFLAFFCRNYQELCFNHMYKHLLLSWFLVKFLSASFL